MCDICKAKVVMFIDVKDQFSNDRSFYGKDGFHLSYVWKAILGRVLDEGIAKGVGRDMIKIQGNQSL